MKQVCPTCGHRYEPTRKPETKPRRSFSAEKKDLIRARIDAAPRGQKKIVCNRIAEEMGGSVSHVIKIGLRYA